MSPPADVAPPPAVRNPWLDVLRGLAALAVTFHHLNCIFPRDHLAPGLVAWRSVWDHGHLGVPVFFTLSGYCIFQTWLRSPGPVHFARRRLRRIFPAYYASLVLVLAVVGVTWLSTGVNDVTPLPSTPGAIVATLALLTTPATAVKSVNWVYWTLPYELAFYLVSAALLVVPSASARLRAFVLVNAALCLLPLVGLASATGPGFFIGLWPLFGLGAALAAFPRAPLTSLLVIATVVFAVPPSGIDPAYLLVATATLACLAITRRLPLPRPLIPLRSLGEISYSLYLVHIPVGVFGFQRILVALYPPSAAPAFISLQLLALALTLAFAYAFHRIAEKPFLLGNAHLPTPASS